ncbi:MAG: biotin/lipoyl-binding protein [Oscillospiraceae bacterium]|nr:biotin/lipoyl-binding protein [Oscillospiraceae bacterium]
MKSKKPRILKRGLCLLLSLAAILSLSGCYLLPKEEQILEAPELTVAAVTYATQEVELSSIERWANGTGTFVSRYSESYFFEDEGILKKIYIKSGQTVKEGDIIAELDTEALQEKIEYQEYQTERSRLNYLNASQYNSTSYQAQLAKLDYDYQQRQLEKLYAQKTQSVLYAGFDGIATFVSSAAPGDAIPSGKVLASIADQTAMELRWEPSDLDDIYIGMEVEITLRTGNVTFTGVVSQTPAELPEDLEDADRKGVYIRFDDAKLDELPGIGESAFISVLLERKDNVIVINAKNLYSTNKRNYVRVLINDIPEERDVTVGISNGTQVEITSGLEIGEKLVI